MESDRPDPMFLVEIEQGTRGTPLLKPFGRGPAPQILHLFAYKPAATRHLAAYTHEVMRGPSPLSAGIRELIAAFTSGKNRCPF